ncbi:hypothetical protein DFH09DRAFT_1366569 [Mycena vulgaris]|nr:hypothetical protein DFH09DRAFT_1366569 [Mycena vulgaris]
MAPKWLHTDANLRFSIHYNFTRNDGAEQQPQRNSPSPDWDDFDLNDSQGRGPDPEFQPSVSPSPPPSATTPNESNSHESDDPLPSTVVNTMQSRNARSARWMPWQDRLLIQEVEKRRPFTAARGDATRDAWAALAVELLKDSMMNGTAVDRTGAACLARFQKLLKAHNADQTKSLQKTGTDEEVTQHIELMTQVVELFDAQKFARHERSAAVQKKADLETTAALELRDGAMRGLIRRENLTDVALLDGASVREKQGQRKRRRAADNSDSEKENEGSNGALRPKRRRNQLAEIVKGRNAADAKRLEQARKRDEERHAETLALQQRSLDLQQDMAAGLGQLSQGLAVLATAQAKLTEFEFKRSEAEDRRRYDDAERRRADAERRAIEAERHAGLLSAISRTNQA